MLKISISLSSLCSFPLWLCCRCLWRTLRFVVLPLFVLQGRFWMPLGQKVVLPLTVLPFWALALVVVSLQRMVQLFLLVSPLPSVLLPVLALVLFLPLVLHYQSLLRLPLSYINIIDNFLYFQNLVSQIRFVQSFQFEGSVSNIIVFYLDDFVGLIAPFWVILLPLGVVVFFLLKDLDHIIHFHLWIFASVLFPPCQIHPDVHMVLVVVGILGFHFRGWMDGVIVFIQCFGQHNSPTTTIKPDPVVYHIFHCPYETLHNISVSWGDDVSDAFFLKKVFYPCLEGTVIITKNGHRKTHFVETLFQCRQGICSWLFFHRDNISQLAEDVNNNHRIFWFIILDWNFRLWFFGKGFHMHYVNLEFKPCEGCGVGVWTPVFSNLFVGLFPHKVFHIHPVDGLVLFLAFLRVSLIEPKPVSRL